MIHNRNVRQPLLALVQIALAGLCAAMALLFLLALLIPFLRDFYELSTPTRETVVAWAAGSALGVAAMLATVRLPRFS